MLKKKDKNYSLKRKNIEKTTYSFDENNNLYLTLPKFDYGKRIRDLINDKKINDVDILHKNPVILEQSMDQSRHKLEDLIPEFFQNINTKSDESDQEFDFEKEENSSLNSSLNEEEKKELFEKLRTRNKFNLDNKINSNRYRNLKNGAEFPIKNNSLSINESKNLQNKFSIFQTSTVSPKMRPSHSSLLEDDPLFQNFKKMKEKLTLIKKINKEKKKKKKIIAADVFFYDKKKWEIQRIKESDRIVRRLNDLEKKRKDWNEKHIPDLNLPFLPIVDMKRGSINRKVTMPAAFLHRDNPLEQGKFF